MPGPLVRAASGASYNGAFGTDAGDFAKSAAAFMQGRKQEEAARSAQAMQDALLALRQREADQGDARIQFDRDQMGEQRHQFDVTSGLNRDRFGLDQQKFSEDQRQFGIGADFDNRKLGQQASEGEKDRANALEIAKIGARSREHVAGMRQVGSGRDFVTLQDANGGYWRFNKLTNELNPIQVPSPADLGQAPADGAAAAPATGGQLLGAGARPSQGEREAAGTYASFKMARDKLAENMGTVGNEAPGVGTQLLLDGTKASGLGPVSSLTRSLSNTLLGDKAPQYQMVQNSIDATGSLFVKLMTGAQMSEPEALRLFNVIGPKAGDTPDVVTQKMAQLDNIVQAQYVKLGRAGELDSNGLPPITRSMGQPTPAAPSAPSGKSPADRWEELRAQGLSPEAATAQVKQEMGQ